MAVFFHYNIVLHCRVIPQFVHFTWNEHLGYFHFEILRIMPSLKGMFFGYTYVASLYLCTLSSRIAGLLGRMYLSSVDMSKVSKYI